MGRSPPPLPTTASLEPGLGSGAGVAWKGAETPGSGSSQTLRPCTPPHLDYFSSAPSHGVHQNPANLTGIGTPLSPPATLSFPC